MKSFCPDDAPPIFVLVGNKSDKERVVSAAEAEKLAAKYDWPYIESSALFNENVEEMFALAILEVKKKM